MNKQCKVVMLPTTKAENSIVTDNGLDRKNAEYYEGLFTQQYLRHMCKISHHLYIVINEEIKEGDYFYDTEFNTVSKAPHHLAKDDTVFLVVATTDTLVIGYEELETYRKVIKLPQPSQAFIEQYIKIYNTKDIQPIDYIFVEYEGGCCGGCNEIDDECIPSPEIPKLREDNTIIINKLNKKEEISSVWKQALNEASLKTVLIKDECTDDYYNAILEYLDEHFIIFPKDSKIYTEKEVKTLLNKLGELYELKQSIDDCNNMGSRANYTKEDEELVDNYSTDFCIDIDKWNKDNLK